MEIRLDPSLKGSSLSFEMPLGSVKTGDGVARRVYRMSLGAGVIGGVAVALSVILGLSMVLIDSGERGEFSTRVLGAVILLGSAVLGALFATNRLLVTEAGLVHYYNFRSISVSWREIEDIGVGSGRSAMGWPCPAIRLSGYWVPLTSVSSFTKNYPERVAQELSEFQQKYGNESHDLSLSDVHEVGGAFSVSAPTKKVRGEALRGGDWNGDPFEIMRG